MEANDSVDSCYMHIKLALGKKLLAQGYQPVHEEHHDAVYNSRYIIWSDNREALKLTWDGNEQWFTLTITQDLPIHATTRWQEITVTPFNAKQCNDADRQAVIQNMLNSLA